MSDRLTELQRQRALIQDHLAWLEKEIADTANTSGPSARPSSVSTQQATPVPAAPAAVLRNADELIAKFGTDTKDTTQSARRGCFIVFGAMLVPTLGFLGYMIYLFFRDRP